MLKPNAAESWGVGAVCGLELVCTNATEATSGLLI